MMKKLAVVAVFGLMSQAFAGPFGLSQGLPIDEVVKLGQFVPGEGTYTYVAKSVLSGHPDFDSYSILLTPKQGLCSVIAVSKDIYSDAYGHQLKRKFNELTSALSQKYGYPQISFDFSRTFDLSQSYGFWKLDGIWIEDNTWMNSLLDRTRTLNATWEEANRNNINGEWIATSNLLLPDSLIRIRLNALARSANRGYMRLEYRFSNYAACVEAVDLKKNSNL
jgi:hypothetical protein